jgi:hypothetical protein
MRLQNLIDECTKAIMAEAFETYEPGEYVSIAAKVEKDDYLLDLYYYRDNKRNEWLSEVMVNHKFGEDMRCSSNVERYMEEHLNGCVDWRVIEDQYKDWNMNEFERNGFADEADFWRWKEGR